MWISDQSPIFNPLPLPAWHIPHAAVMMRSSTDGGIPSIPSLGDNMSPDIREGVQGADQVGASLAAAGA